MGDVGLAGVCHLQLHRRLHLSSGRLRLHQSQRRRPNPRLGSDRGREPLTVAFLDDVAPASGRRRLNHGLNDACGVFYLCDHIINPWRFQAPVCKSVLLKSSTL